MNNKPIKPKPLFYALCFESLQQIAKDNGYNLLLHGSLNRDMDLVCVAWNDNPISHIALINKFCDYLGVYQSDYAEHFLFNTLPGGRSAYVINLNRNWLKDLEGNVIYDKDQEYYLDISFTPFYKTNN